MQYKYIVITGSSVLLLSPDQHMDIIHVDRIVPKAIHSPGAIKLLVSGLLT